MNEEGQRCTVCSGLLIWLASPDPPKVPKKAPSRPRANAQMLKDEQALMKFEMEHLPNDHVVFTGSLSPSKKHNYIPNNNIMKAFANEVAGEYKYFPLKDNLPVPENKKYMKMIPPTNSELKEMELENQLTGDENKEVATNLHTNNLNEDAAHDKYFCKPCKLILKKCISCGNLSSNLDVSFECSSCAKPRESFILHRTGITFNLGSKITFDGVKFSS